MIKEEEILSIQKGFNDVVNIISKGHFDIATKIINKLYNKSLELKYEEGVFLYYENNIEILFEKHENHLVFPFLMYVIKNKKESNISKLGNFNSKLGIVLSRLFDFESSLTFLNKGLRLNLNIKPLNISNVISSYIGFADNFYRQKQFKKALEFINAAYKQVEKSKLESEIDSYSCFYLRVFKIRILLKLDKVLDARNAFDLIDHKFILNSKQDTARFKELELDFAMLEDCSSNNVLKKAQNLLKLAIELDNRNLRIRILKILRNIYTELNDTQTAYMYASQLIKLLDIENNKQVDLIDNKSVELPNEIVTESSDDFEIYLKKDIETTVKFQSDFFKFDFNEKLDARTLYIPSKTISGDYLSSFKLGSENNHYLVVLADTVGKGIAASYLSFMLNGIIKSIIYNTHSFKLTNIIKDVNSILSDIFKDSGFISLWAGIIDIKNNTLESINAGHLPTFFLTEKNDLVELNKGTTILGMFEELPFLESETVPFNEGCSLIAYTDGVTETENSIGEFYEKRFLKLVNQYSKDRSINFIKFLEADLNLFKDYSLEQDDVSCVVINYKK